MAFVPGPGRGNDVFDISVSGFPGKFFHQFAGRGDQCRRVSGPAGGDFAGDLDPCYGLASGNDLENGVAGSRANVVDTGCGVGCGQNGQAMCLGQVFRMHIVAQAGSVRCGVVGAIHINMRFLAQGNLQDERDEVIFRTMIFSKLSISKVALKSRRNLALASLLDLKSRHLEGTGEVCNWRRWPLSWRGRLSFALKAREGRGPAAPDRGTYSAAAYAGMTPATTPECSDAFTWLMRQSYPPFVDAPILPNSGLPPPFGSMLMH